MHSKKLTVWKSFLGIQTSGIDVFALLCSCHHCGIFIIWYFNRNYVSLGVSQYFITQTEWFNWTWNQLNKNCVQNPASVKSNSCCCFLLIPNKGILDKVCNYLGFDQGPYLELIPVIMRWEAMIGWALVGN